MSDIIAHAPMTEPLRLDALCQTPDGAFVVVIDHLTPDGCTATAPAAWDADFEFLRLTLAGQAEINGRVVHREGTRAEIRFFGQIHPCVIDSWQRRFKQAA